MAEKTAGCDETYIPWYSNEYTESMSKGIVDYMSMTPKEIRNELEKRVVNQEEACKRISIMMYQHLHGHRFVGLLAGPTGSGKSFIAESLKEMFPNIVFLRDVSNVTCDGWRGEKKVSTLFQGVISPESYNGKVYPLIFLDESDKLFSPKITSGGENASASVQSEFLSVIHGCEYKVIERDADMYERRVTRRIIDTGKISFLFAGAFENKARSIAENESGSTIGFGASQKKVSSYDRELTAEDIIEAGCMTELCGRIQRIICLNKFGEEDYRGMLDISDHGPLSEMEKEFGIPIHISDRKKDEIAHEAFESGLGIRGIKNALRGYIDELVWDDCQAKLLEIA